MGKHSFFLKLLQRYKGTSDYKSDDWWDWTWGSRLDDAEEISNAQEILCLPELPSESSHKLIFSPEQIALNLAPDLFHRDHSAATAHHPGSCFKCCQQAIFRWHHFLRGSNPISFQYTYQSLLNFLIYLTRTSPVLLSEELLSQHTGSNYTRLINRLCGRAAILSSKSGQTDLFICKSN